MLALAFTADSKALLLLHQDKLGIVETADEDDPPDVSQPRCLQSLAAAPLPGAYGLSITTHVLACQAFIVLVPKPFRWST